MNPATELTATSNIHASTPCATALQPRPLALPSVDDPWRYAWAWGGVALRGLVGTHRLRRGQAPCYSAPVQVSPRLAGRWREVFDVPVRAAGAVPLQINQSVGTLLHSRIFADLGLSPRHGLHLQHRTVHPAGVAACANVRRQQLTCHVPRLLRMGQDKVMVQVQTQVAGCDGQPLAEVQDGFLIGGLPPEDLDGLAADSALLRELLGLRRRLPRLCATDGTSQTVEMPVPRRMGLAYGRISGNLDAVHTSRLGAWLAGRHEPVLQGLALRNLIVRHLAELRVPMQRLNLTFAGPVRLAQTLRLVVAGSALEVLDDRGRLVAFGSSQ